MAYGRSRRVARRTTSRRTYRAAPRRSTSRATRRAPARARAQQTVRVVIEQAPANTVARPLGLVMNEALGGRKAKF